MQQFIVRLDSMLTIAITNWPSRLRTPFLIITAISQPIVLAIGAISAVIVAGQSPASFALIAAVGATGANAILKRYIRRPRPDTLYARRMRMKSPSFPSGHAFATTVLLGVGAYVAALHLAIWWATLLVCATIIFIAAVGLSRVYLGAHYPTDVVAGWMLGAFSLWAIIVCIA